MFYLLCSHVCDWSSTFPAPPCPPSLPFAPSTDRPRCPFGQSRPETQSPARTVCPSSAQQITESENDLLPAPANVTAC